MSISSLIVFILLAALLVVLLSRLASLAYIKSLQKSSIPVEEFTLNGKLLEPGMACYPVRYGTAEHHKRFFRLLPWEAVGVLLVSDGEFKFLGKKTNGEALSFALPRNDSFMSYVEKKFIRDGGLSWFMIESREERHYFTTEGKLPSLSTEFGTTGLYQQLTERYSDGNTIC